MNTHICELNKIHNQICVQVYFHLKDTVVYVEKKRKERRKKRKKRDTEKE